MGHVGRFQAVGGTRFPRHTRVVLRTRRGMELGEVLDTPHGLGSDDLADGAIVRAVTVEDQLLEARLEKNRQEAYEACCQLIDENRLPAVLIDVEHLYDGQGLFFYFLGDVPAELESYTEMLAAAYETKVQFRQFTDTLIQGCGPDCGTEAAQGQGGCDSCSSCAVAAACGTRG
jgi:cell fate regulator YaaT (PSP1 superfamily)